MQDNGLVPIVEPEILLDGDHPIERTLEVAEKVWSEVFFYLAENNVVLEGILLKPSMVTPGAEHKEKASPESIAEYTLTMLKRRVPPAVPGIMVWTLATFLNLVKMIAYDFLFRQWWIWAAKLVILYELMIWIKSVSRELLQLLFSAHHAFCNYVFASICCRSVNRHMHMIYICEYDL